MVFHSDYILCQSYELSALKKKNKIEELVGERSLYRNRVP